MMTTQIICTQCNKLCPHIKGLIDHYELKHPELLKRYSIRHRPSGNSITMSAPNEDTILKFQGWDKENCKIEEI